MTIKRLLTAAYASAYFVGAATAEQVTPSVDALTDGIRTFICDFEDSGPTSIILVENEDRWRIVGDEVIDDVAEISSGFRFRTSKSESFLGILKEVNDQWIFNYLSEHWSFSGKCQIMDEFSEKLVSAIAPKIFENADSLEAELRKIKEELRVSKDLSTSFNRRLIDLERENKISEKNNKFLKDKIIAIQKREKETIERNDKLLERNDKLLRDEILAIRIRYANLLESVTNGHAVKAYEFISEALSVKEVTKRIAFVQGGGLGDATGRDKFCVDLLMNQPTKFGDTCRRRLIMYMIEDAERKRDLSASMSSDHLREPLTAEKQTTSSASMGPALTDAEKDALRVAVSSCWNVGSLSADALTTTVVVGVSLQETGVPDSGSIRLVSFSGGSESGARQAFEAARRAIIRCGAQGFPLPVEKYSQWREIKMVFDPEGLRLR